MFSEGILRTIMRIVITTTKLSTTLIILTLLFGCKKQVDFKFDGIRALQDVEYQLSLGPRIIGGVAHQQFVDWAVREFETSGWETEVQTSQWSGNQIKNIIARRGDGEPWIILGAHYDSRFFADQDPDPNNHNVPVPGANDGASGV